MAVRVLGDGWRGIALVCALALTVAGCSFLFVDAPSDNPRRSAYVSCTTSSVAPVVDSIFTTTNALGVAVVAGDSSYTNRGSRIALGLGVMTLWLSSAIYGFHSIGECRERNRLRPLGTPEREWRREQEEDDDDKIIAQASQARHQAAVARAFGEAAAAASRSTVKRTP